MSALDPLFEQFLRERLYLKNVTPSTITRADLQRFVIHLRDRGVQPVSCNSWLRAMNAFCRWLHEEGHAPAFAKLQPLRLEKKVRRTHPEGAILTFRPKNYAEWRGAVFNRAAEGTGAVRQDARVARR
jgi:hypothetical protein